MTNLKIEQLLNKLGLADKEVEIATLDNNGNIVKLDKNKSLSEIFNLSENNEEDDEEEQRPNIRFYDPEHGYRDDADQILSMEDIMDLLDVITLNNMTEEQKDELASDITNDEGDINYPKLINIACENLRELDRRKNFINKKYYDHTKKAINMLIERCKVSIEYTTKMFTLEDYIKSAVDNKKPSEIEDFFKALGFELIDEDDEEINEEETINEVCEKEFDKKEDFETYLQNNDVKRLSYSETIDYMNNELKDIEEISLCSTTKKVTLEKKNGKIATIINNGPVILEDEKFLIKLDIEDDLAGFNEWIPFSDNRIFNLLSSNEEIKFEVRVNTNNIKENEYWKNILEAVFIDKTFSIQEILLQVYLHCNNNLVIYKYVLDLLEVKPV